MTLKLPVGLLLATAQAAATKVNDLNAGLTGVLIERGDGCVYLRGTDRIMLIVARVVGQEFPEDWPNDVFVPHELLAQVRPSCGTVEIDLVQEGSDKWSITVSQQGRPTVSGPMIWGKVFNWRKVLAMSLESSGEAAQFDPAVLARFGKAAKLAGDDTGHVLIEHNGTRSAVVVFSNRSLIGLIMPLDFEGTEMPVPDWVQKIAKEEQ